MQSNETIYSERSIAERVEMKYVKFIEKMKFLKLEENILIFSDGDNMYCFKLSSASRHGFHFTNENIKDVEISILLKNAKSSDNESIFWAIMGKTNTCFFAFEFYMDEKRHILEQISTKGGYGRFSGLQSNETIYSERSIAERVEMKYVKFIEKMKFLKLDENTLIFSDGNSMYYFKFFSADRHSIGFSDKNIENVRIWIQGENAGFKQENAIFLYSPNWTIMNKDGTGYHLFDFYNYEGCSILEQLHGKVLTAEHTSFRVM